MNLDRIPAAMKERPQWVLWRMEAREPGQEATKIPYEPSGRKRAKAGDSTTWGSYETAAKAYGRGKWSGIGYEFDTSDPFCGIDLDGCRDPDTGKVADWAREIILSLDTYAEVSPSGSGVKLFCVAKSPMDTGKKKVVAGAESIGGKQPAIEIYDWGRFFAMTGLKLAGVPGEPQERQEQLAALVKRYWPAEQPVVKAANFYAPDAVIDRARKYVAKIPPAISGQGGHNATFKTACILVCGFGLSEQEALSVLSEWNAGCNPPWSERELMHKIRSAFKQPGDRGYLRNASQYSWASIPLPDYQPEKQSKPKPEPRLTTLKDAAESYIELLRSDTIELIDSGLPDLDYAVGGGFARGEMVIVAARPSHGKSAAALQMIHAWTLEGRSCLMVSEEMSSLMLGKRTLQFISDTPEEHWKHSVTALERDVAHYSDKRAQCLIAESCGTAEAAIEQIEKAVAEHKVECVVLDYAQLLRSPGKTRYEQVTATSIALKQAAAKHRVLMVVLCQLSREIENRNKFIPQMSDIKETGQLEQDADVIVFLVWPHRIDATQPAEEYQLYVAKNRNRGIMSPCVKARFIPSRQMIAAPRIQEHRNYQSAFDDYNRLETEF